MALVLGVLGLMWLLGFVASLVCYPHVISDERLRSGVFHDICVPTAAIHSIGTTTGAPPSQKSAARSKDELIMAVVGQAKRSEYITRIVFYANQTEQVRKLIDAAAQH